MTRATRRFTILDLMLLVAGVAVGLWVVIRTNANPANEGVNWVLSFVFVLGGLSIIGPPLLIRERRRRRSRLRPGEMFWFCQGTASWLLWPPMVIRQMQDKNSGTGMATICYFYGTPLMALYVTLALLAGGWLRRPRRGRRARRTWTEMFGLLLGLLWACTGLYLLVTIYQGDLFE